MVLAAADEEGSLFSQRQEPVRGMDGDSEIEDRARITIEPYMHYVPEKIGETQTERGGIMVAYNQEKGVEPVVTVDCICPKCFRPLPGPRLFDEPDRYGRKLRKYLGFCASCNLGCEVIQFHRDERWVIHKYQHYKPIEPAMHYLATGQWITLAEMPEPAPVVTGPGGEFDQQITPKIDSGVVEMLKKLRLALE
jgi:hypothetical protein